MMQEYGRCLSINGRFEKSVVWLSMTGFAPELRVVE
ncbi:hypothetical protein HNQ88_004379 [Aureibacter tunicatorum]|uniref:Uncharacterized protein n=1 Tax=Aureibacter tunicatorum TaxID=866807 RepID=A0AAE4BU10_9BACT|nr:hypothetical protein [Aureibacter tunicatorum]